MPTESLTSSEPEVQALRSQTERLSAMLAATESEKLKLDADLRHTRQLLRQAKERDTSSTAKGGGASREQQLMDEGRKLAEEVGKERERVKALLGERKQLEAKIAKLEADVEAASKRERQGLEAKELVAAERDRLKERLTDLQSERESHATTTESKLLAIDDLQQKLADQRAESLQALQDVQAKLNAVQARRHDEMADAASEIAALKAEISRTLVLCDQRVSSAERDMAALTTRAHLAEARCFELTQSTADVSSDYRVENERLENQLRTAISARKAAELQLVSARKNWPRRVPHFGKPTRARMNAAQRGRRRS
jgi:chromosome segregation ATPase